MMMVKRGGLGETYTSKNVHNFSLFKKEWGELTPNLG
ncbi:hypothetical protein C21_03961 [Arenibacter sp. NBRC 103722]|nr:hypothetical protein C21_03961 [Arenibacter sp. NBRC 103722]